MLAKLFQKVSKPVLAMGVALSLMATSAFGGSFYDEKYRHLDFQSRQKLKAQCTNEMIKNTPVFYSTLNKNGDIKIVREEGNPRHSVKLLNLANASDACVAAAADDLSHNKQVWLLESEHRKLRTTTAKAAHEVEKETGKDITIVLYKDTNLSDNLTIISAWAGGHQREPYEIPTDELTEVTGIKELANIAQIRQSQYKKDIVSMGKDVQKLKDDADKNQLAK